ncbi:transmembrane prediction [Roseimaritima sediminicola]|uniref:transmembrane prediction n=1 Tax=Roseimaritima sediminicola TaxID=2662066 RepID=UPI001F3C2CED|nr:transmembrane prediction [Roseimaritima sediminicola]
MTQSVNASANPSPSAPPPRYEGQSLEISERLWWIVIGPTLWALHFLACYLTAAIWCAKYAAEADSDALLLILVAIYSVVAVAGIVVFGVISYRNHRRGCEALPEDLDRPRDRGRFIALAGLLLALLSLVATLFTAAVFVLVRGCH